MKYVTAVIETYTQCGPNSYQDIRYSRNFSMDRPLKDILSWAQAMLPESTNPITINDIKLCDYTGDSI